MQAVDKFVALIRPKRNLDCLPLPPTLAPDVRPLPDMKAADVAEPAKTEPDPSPLSWDELQTCVQRMKERHETAMQDHVTEMAAKDLEIERLKGAVDEILAIAFNQQACLRKADEERAAKDQQIAQLLQVIAQRQGKRSSLSREMILDAAEIGGDRHPEIYRPRLAKAA